jgi:hypothetical protein
LLLFYTGILSVEIKRHARSSIRLIFSPVFNQYYLLVAFPIMAIGISFLMMPLAHAQYGDLVPTATPEQLEKCKKLDIEPNECSDNSILEKLGRCLGPNCGASPPPMLDAVTLSTIVGSGIAFVIGILAVRKIRKVRKSD